MNVQITCYKKKAEWKRTERKRVMNISEAKEYIKHSIQVYLKKDEFGDYKIPVVRQRPIFLLGAPGIGKTAIMEQIAQEMGIALVSYSMTHHTRQSALGLPFIKQKEYGGVSYDVSEYTMSEIIASVYETMENSGVNEGILFLDEINCVSETLAPSMLQFLQYKVFGKHKVPEGWVIVTAGNPPEYNKSVREFDVVTMDRLKVLSVEADYDTWKKYAAERGVHGAVLNFLELNRDYFYHMETTVQGRSYVTARGWEDLSTIISLYEEDGLEVDESLVGQYIQNPDIVKEFTAYYDLYNKYKKDYQIAELLSGNLSDATVERAREASFDERLSLVGMLITQMQNEMKAVMETSAYLSELMLPLKVIKESPDVVKELDLQIEKEEKRLKNMELANALSGGERKMHKRVILFLTQQKKALLAGDVSDNEAAFTAIKNQFDTRVNEMKQAVETTKERLHHMFEFVAKAFQGGNEMLILVTELTVNEFSSKFISMFGCEDYHKNNEVLMVSERQKDLKDEILSLF